MVKVAVLLLLPALLPLASAVIPCPDLVDIQQSGRLNYRAVFAFDVPVSTTSDSRWALNLTFDQEFIGVGVWGGSQVEYNGYEKWAVISKSLALEEGQSYSHSFRIIYNLNITDLPELVEAHFQDIKVCPV